MKRRGVAVAFAVVLAVLGTVGVYAYLRGADKRASSDTTGRAVVVATARIAVGTTWGQALKDGTLKVQNMPADATPSDAIDSLTAGIGNDSVAQGDIAAGSPVLRQAFGAATSQTGVLAIPKGKIAVTIELSTTQDVAGYIAPRSQVVVFVTANYHPEGSTEGATGKANPNDGASGTSSGSGTVNGKTDPLVGDQLTITRVVIPDATVIATSNAAPTDLAAKSTDGSTNSNVGGTVQVTLALTQADAQRVINQQKVGELSLALRSADSKISTTDVGYTNTIESGSHAPAQTWAK